MFTSQYRLSTYEGLPEMAAGVLACHCLRAIPQVRFALVPTPWIRGAAQEDGRRDCMMCLPIPALRLEAQ